MTVGDMDALVFTAIHGGSAATANAVLIATLIAKLLIYGLPVHMAALWLWGDDNRRQTALMLLLALVCGLAASHLIGLGFYRPRPFLAGLGEPLMHHRPNAAFPSNHALVFSAYASTLLLLRSYRLAAGVFTVGILVGLARIYLGVHYPGDILGGFLLGAAAAMVSLWIWPRWGDHLYRGASFMWRCIPRPVRRLLREADGGRTR